MPKKPSVDFREKLVKYMEGKGKLAGDFFFTEKDERAIRKWPNRESKKVWKKLVHNIEVLYIEHIVAQACPFCIKYENKPCGLCEWGKHHGKCPYNPHSDVFKIKGIKKFTNKFYKSLIKKIEKGEINGTNSGI